MNRALTWLALGMISAGAALDSRAAEPAAPAYEDRVLDSAPQPSAEDLEASEPSTGWPRGGSIELQSHRERVVTDTRNQTLQITGFLDTPNYGAFSTDLNLNRNRSAVTAFDVSGLGGNLYNLSYINSNTGRIDQRAMPFNNGWFANNSIGDINTAATPMSRGLDRVSLPSLPIEGASTVIEQPGRTQLNASAGRLGFFDGLNSQGFTVGRGNVATFGGQQQLTGDSSALGVGRTDTAFQWADARDVNLNGITGYAQNTQSFWGAVAWQGVAPWADGLASGIGSLAERPGGLRVQANFAHSAGQPSNFGSLAPHDSANGFWVDANWRNNWAQQGASVFRFDPALRWGSTSLAGDLQGASWRADVSTRQWQLSTNIEASDSVSGLTGRSLFANLFNRYRFDSRDAISGTVAARTGAQAAQSAQVTWEHISPTWGQSQWRTDVAHGRNEQVVRFGLDQAWAVAEASTFSTTLALEQNELFGVTSRSVIWGALGGTPFLASGRLDLSVRGSNGIGGNSARFLNANARVSWTLGAGWSFYVQYTASNGQESLNPAVVSALTAATTQPIILLPSSRSLMVALRYDARAGFSSAPIGGSPGVGSGRLEGHVFFDQNSNGQREANEGGVGGVTIVLNGRFSTRTDAQGFYSFPAVAAGTHEIELVPDNLPLPWSSPGAATRRVDVFVRDTATADFPIQRDR